MDVVELLRQLSMHIGRLFGYGGAYYCLITIIKISITPPKNIEKVDFIDPKFGSMLVTSLGLFLSVNNIYLTQALGTFNYPPSIFSLFIAIPLMNILCIITWYGAFKYKSVKCKSIAYDPFFQVGLGSLALAAWFIRFLA